MARDDDVDAITRSARAAGVSSDLLLLHVLVMLSLICKAVRDLQPKNAT